MSKLVDGSSAYNLGSVGSGNKDLDVGNKELDPGNKVSGSRPRAEYSSLLPRAAFALEGFILCF